MSNRLRVGLVGADAAGRGWGAAIHIPALEGLDEVELAAVCTSRAETAAAAASRYGVPGFHDARELAAEPHIDLIATVVRVPFHAELAHAALDGGKHVFCEWPLGRTASESRRLAAAAAAQGVVTAVGLQGRQDPALNWVRQRRLEGWLGDIVSVNVAMLGGGLGHTTSGNAWMGEARNGANPMTIVLGHVLDYVEYCFGSVRHVAASVRTRAPEWHVDDTGESIEVDAPDSIIVAGDLDEGAALSVTVATVPNHGSGWRMEAYGTEGTIVATTPGMPQITPISLTGAQHDRPLRPIDFTASREGLQGVPEGPSQNIARAYRGLANAIAGGTGFTPGFADAARLHRLLDTIQRSSDEGRAIPMETGG